ncbi:TPA: PIN domain-containing protein [Aeromonas hydrophila]
MIHVALDTAIYRKNPRLDSPEFKALSFLAKNNFISLHIPYFVEREFKSFLEIEQDKKIKNAMSALASACEFKPQGAATESLSSILQELRLHCNDLVGERGNAFIKWANDAKANRYKLSKEETEFAFEAYFSGTAPFKEAKVRADIPDAFIYQSLLSIHHVQNLNVIVEDKKLSDACNDAKMSCFSDINSFLNNPAINELLIGNINNNILEAIHTHIGSYLSDNEKILLEKIEEVLLSDEYRTISGDNIPGEANEIYVSGVHFPSYINIHDSIEYYGDSIFTVDFDAMATLEYEYAVSRYDAIDLDSKYVHIEDLNDYYVNVCTSDNFVFNGRIELQFSIALDEITSIHELVASISNLEIKIESLDDFAITDDE